jgi:hypothetical protein
LIASRSGEHFGELPFVELGAGRDLVFDQHLAQPLRDLLVQGRARNGDDFCCHGSILYAKERAVKATCGERPT